MKIDDLILAGDIYRTSGYGQLIRETAAALKPLVGNITLHNMFIEPSHTRPISGFEITNTNHLTNGSTVLAVVPPEFLPMLRAPNLFGYTMLEAFPAPRKWVRSIEESGVKALFTTSQFCKRSFEAAGVTVPIHIVPNIFEPSVMPPPVTCDDTCFLKSLSPYVLYSGSALKRKGIDLFVQVAKRCPEINFIMKLNIVDGIGVGFNSKMLGENNVYLFVGGLPRLQMNHMMQHAALGLYMARCDTISKFPMELAHYGIPCITGGHSGLGEWTPKEYAVSFREVAAEEVYEGLTWYEPDVDEAAEMVRNYISNPRKYDRSADLSQFGADKIAAQLMCLMEMYSD